MVHVYLASMYYFLNSLSDFSKNLSLKSFESLGARPSHFETSTKTERPTARNIFLTEIIDTRISKSGHTISFLKGSGRPSESDLECSPALAGIAQYVSHEREWNDFISRPRPLSRICNSICPAV